VGRTREQQLLAALTSPFASGALDLLALNKLLDGFLHNPIFSDAGEIDLQLAAKARRDLEDITVLSEKLRKNADKRSKTSGKPE
jgi:hypothetical protein